MTTDGCPEELLQTGDTVTVRINVVREVGLVAALVLHRIEWRTQIRPDGWQATISAIAEDCGLGADATRRALTSLRKRGWLSAVRSSSTDPTLIWLVVVAKKGSKTRKRKEKAIPAGRSVNEETTVTRSGEPQSRDEGNHTEVGAKPDSGWGQNLIHSSMKTVEDLEDIPDASASGAEAQPALVEEPASIHPLPTAQHLVAAWIDGFTAEREQPPHAAVVKRVAGQCANLGKQCHNVDEWRAAWRAARDAGKRGRVDVTGHLADFRPARTDRTSLGATRSAQAEQQLARLEQLQKTLGEIEGGKA